MISYFAVILLFLSSLAQAQYVPESAFESTFYCRPDTAQFVRIPVVNPPSFVMQYTNGSTTDYATWNTPSSYGPLLTVSGGLTVLSVIVKPGQKFKAGCAQPIETSTFSTNTTVAANCSHVAWMLWCASPVGRSITVCAGNVTYIPEISLYFSTSSFDFTAVASALGEAPVDSSATLEMRLLWVPTLLPNHPECYPRYLTVAVDFKEILDPESSVVAVILFVILAAVVLAFVVFFGRYMIKKHCSKFQRSVQAKPVKHRPTYVTVGQGEGGGGVWPQQPGEGDDGNGDLPSEGDYTNGEKDYELDAAGEGEQWYGGGAFSPPQTNPPPRTAKGTVLVDSGVQLQHTELPPPWFERYGAKQQQQQQRRSNAMASPSPLRQQRAAPPTTFSQQGRQLSVSAASPPPRSFANASSPNVMSRPRTTVMSPQPPQQRAAPIINPYEE